MIVNRMCKRIVTRKTNVLFAQMFCVFVWMTTMGFLPYWQCKQNKTKQGKKIEVFAYNINNFPTEKKKKSYLFLQVP